MGDPCGATLRRSIRTERADLVRGGIERTGRCCSDSTIGLLAGPSRKVPCTPTPTSPSFFFSLACSPAKSSSATSSSDTSSSAKSSSARTSRRGGRSPWGVPLPQETTRRSPRGGGGEPRAHDPACLLGALQPHVDIVVRTTRASMQAIHCQYSPVLQTWLHRFGSCTAQPKCSIDRSIHPAGSFLQYLRCHHHLLSSVP